MDDQSGLRRPALERLHHRVDRVRAPDSDDRLRQVLPTFGKTRSQVHDQPPARTPSSTPPGRGPSSRHGAAGARAAGRRAATATGA